MANKEVDTGILQDPTISFTMGEDKAETDAGAVEVEAAKKTEDTDVEMVDDEVDQDATDTPEEGSDETAEDQDESDESDADEDLGEFVAEDVEKWDAKYQNDEGELNQELLTSEFEANFADGTADINEGTRAYLKSKGISDGMIDAQIAAYQTIQEAAKNAAKDHDLKLFEIAGDTDTLKDALAWGKSEGYSEEQKKRFNAVMDGDDLLAREEAVEILMARYNKANPKTKPKPRLPQRDATKGQGRKSNTPAIRPFANKDEWRQAKRDAGDDHERVREVAIRRRASKF